MMSHFIFSRRSCLQTVLALFLFDHRVLWRNVLPTLYNNEFAATRVSDVRTCPFQQNESDNFSRIHEKYVSKIVFEFQQNRKKYATGNKNCENCNVFDNIERNLLICRTNSIVVLLRFRTLSYTFRERFNTGNSFFFFCFWINYSKKSIIDHHRTAIYTGSCRLVGYAHPIVSRK